MISRACIALLSGDRSDGVGDSQDLVGHLAQAWVAWPIGIVLQDFRFAERSHLREAERFGLLVGEEPLLVQGLDQVVELILGGLSLGERAKWSGTERSGSERSKRSERRVRMGNISFRGLGL